MVVNRTALWGLIATCCLVAVPAAVRFKLRTRDRAPVLAACVDGVMTGLAVGIGTASLIFLAAAGVAQLD